MDECSGRRLREAIERWKETLLVPLMRSVFRALRGVGRRNVRKFCTMARRIVDYRAGTQRRGMEGVGVVAEGGAVVVVRER